LFDARGVFLYGLRPDTLRIAPTWYGKPRATVVFWVNSSLCAAFRLVGAPAPQWRPLCGMMATNDAIMHASSRSFFARTPLALANGRSLNGLIWRRLDNLQRLYGTDQSLQEILDGLSARLHRARRMYGTDKSIAQVVDGIYARLDKLLEMYGPVEEILDGIVDLKKQLNRLVELQSKVMVSAQEHEEIEHLKRLFRRYVYDLARQKAQLHS
jgi:hypothetical protein